MLKITRWWTVPRDSAERIKSAKKLFYRKSLDLDLYTQQCLVQNMYMMLKILVGPKMGRYVPKSLYVCSYFLNFNILCRPAGRNFKIGWPVKCLFPPKVGVAHYTFLPYIRQKLGWPGPPRPPLYLRAWCYTLKIQILYNWGLFLE